MYACEATLRTVHCLPKRLSWFTWVCYFFCLFVKKKKLNLAFYIGKTLVNLVTLHQPLSRRRTHTYSHSLDVLLNSSVCVCICLGGTPSQGITEISVPALPRSFSFCYSVSCVPLRFIHWLIRIWTFFFVTTVSLCSFYVNGCYFESNKQRRKKNNLSKMGFIILHSRRNHSEIQN